MNAADMSPPVVEQGLCIDCEGDTLVGVLTRPAPDAGPVSGVGVLIAVGGPQYRAGSHRQFRLLARRLAQTGHVVLRFDSRGMGDSSGRFPGFEALEPDLQAATAALRAQAGVVAVVWWGLCDAASAALLGACGPARPDGLVLLNPWVRNATTLAKVQVKQYYGQRLLEGAFWRKLLSGQVDLLAALGGLLSRVAQAMRRPPSAVGAPEDFRQRMARGALQFGGPQLYVLSGRDHVSAEFLEFVRGDPALKGLWGRPQVERMDLAQADHTFSSQERRAAVEQITIDWLNRHMSRRRARREDPAAV